MHLFILIPLIRPTMWSSRCCCWGVDRVSCNGRREGHIKTYPLGLSSCKLLKLHHPYMASLCEDLRTERPFRTGSRAGTIWCHPAINCSINNEARHIPAWHWHLSVASNLMSSATLHLVWWISSSRKFPRKQGSLRRYAPLTKSKEKEIATVSISGEACACSEEYCYTCLV